MLTKLLVRILDDPIVAHINYGGTPIEYPAGWARRRSKTTRRLPNAGTAAATCFSPRPVKRRQLAVLASAILKWRKATSI